MLAVANGESISKDLLEALAAPIAPVAGAGAMPHPPYRHELVVGGWWGGPRDSILLSWAYPTFQLLSARAVSLANQGKRTLLVVVPALEQVEEPGIGHDSAVLDGAQGTRAEEASVVDAAAKAGGTVEPILALPVEGFRSPYQQRPQAPWVVECRQREKFAAFPSRVSAVRDAGFPASSSPPLVASCSLQPWPGANFSWIPRLPAIAEVGGEVEPTDPVAGGFELMMVVVEGVEGGDEPTEGRQQPEAAGEEESTPPGEADRDEEPT